MLGVVLTGIVGPLGPEGLTVWWDELRMAPHSTTDGLSLSIKVSIAPHYFLIPTGLNLEFSTVILVSSGITLGFILILVICYCGCCCNDWCSQSLLPMRYTYEQILMLKKRRKEETSFGMKSDS